MMSDGPKEQGVEIIKTTCASHCGGSCILKAHVKNGIITRIDTDDDTDDDSVPQLRACLRGRAYRQRVYAPDRVLYPMKRVGKRGEGNLERISWDEALDTVATQLIRIRDTYGPASIFMLTCVGDLHNFHTPAHLSRVMNLAGGYTSAWSMTSFQGGVYAQQLMYGTTHTCNARDDLLNSRLIIMWGWNPTSTITGVNTNWYLAQAKEKGAKIVVVDPRHTDSVATYADQWIPIIPGTDGAMLLAMAYVMIEKNLHDQKFLDTYTIGFEKFKDYVSGAEDGVAKTPGWAEAITGVPAATIVELARAYVTIKPASLMAGISPGRTAYGEQYHRIAITLAAMTGNVGVHGGSSAGRTWESVIGAYPYKIAYGMPYKKGSNDAKAVTNPVDASSPKAPKGAPIGYRAWRVHYNDAPDFILKGKAGGYHTDCKMIALTNISYVNSYPNINKIIKALKSEKLEFIFTTEQFITPTLKFADIVLPSNTYMERNDIANGVGTRYYGYAQKVIDSQGESKSIFEIAGILAKRLGITGFDDLNEEESLRELAKDSEIPDYEKFKQKGIYRFESQEAYVAQEEFIKDSENNPLKTPSGKIEIYSQRLADLNWPNLPPIPKYIETWESRNDPLAAKYPLQMITSHHKRRANCQFETLPWLKELEEQAVLINADDARERGISDGEMVRVFNDRGDIVILARVTERIMPGVVDVPFGSWYDPDEKGVDRGGNPNVLTKDAYSPGGSFAYNTSLVQIEKMR